MDDSRSNNDDCNSTINDSVMDIGLDEDDIDLDLSEFNEEEIMHISEIMQQDKCFKAEHNERKKKIKESFDESITSIEMKNIDSGEKFCLVCSEKFVMIINPRKICTECEKGVCNRCSYKYRNKEIFCKLCYLHNSKDIRTGKWFYSLSKRSGRFRRSSSVIVMSSIRKMKSTKGTPKLNMEIPKIVESEIPLKLNNGDVVPVTVEPKISPEIPKKSYMEREVKEEEVKVKKVLSNHSLTLDVTDADKMSNGSAKHEENIIKPKQLKDEAPIPHKALKSNLGTMTSVSASTMSLYSETEDSYKSGILVSGEIYFSVYYNEADKSLSIYIDQCRNIAVAERKKQRTDPYIKAYLLPDKTKISKKKSTVKKMTVNPIFKETLTYYINKSDLLLRTLSLSVWHKSSLLKYNIFLGEIQLILADINLGTNERNWYLFREKRKTPMRSNGFLFKGEILLRLKYKPSARKDSKGSLHVTVVGASKLESDHNTVNSFVKGYLLPDKDPKSKKKTGICKSTNNPNWNSVLIFPDVSVNELRDRSLELSVYHHNMLKVNEFLGGVRLNLGLGLQSSQHVPWMDADGAEKEAWTTFLSNPHEGNEAIVHLRANMDF